MGVLDIIVLVVIGIFAVLGAIKGFIKSIFGLLSVTVAVLIASLLGGEIAKLISSISSGTGATFGADLANTIHEFLTSQGGIFTSIPTGGYTEGMVIDTLSTIGIPAVIGSVIAPPPIFVCGRLIPAPTSRKSSAGARQGCPTQATEQHPNTDGKAPHPRHQPNARSHARFSHLRHSGSNSRRSRCSNFLSSCRLQEQMERRQNRTPL